MNIPVSVILRIYLKRLQLQWLAFKIVPGSVQTLKFLGRHSHIILRYFIVVWYSARLRAGSGVRVPAGAIHYRVQTGSEAHPASYPVDTRDSFPGGKIVGA
jgi:hypothetical protein